MKTESQIVAVVADRACRSIATSVRKEMQQMDPCLASDFNNAWNELCIQVRDGNSIYEDLYLETVESLILQRVRKLDENTKAAIWHQTGTPGPDEKDQSFEQFSVDDTELVEFIQDVYVLTSAASWGNQAIRNMTE